MISCLKINWLEKKKNIHEEDQTQSQYENERGVSLSFSSLIRLWKMFHYWVFSHMNGRTYLNPEFTNFLSADQRIDYNEVGNLVFRG